MLKSIILAAALAFNPPQPTEVKPYQCNADPTRENVFLAMQERLVPGFKPIVLSKADGKSIVDTILGDAVPPWADAWDHMYIVHKEPSPIYMVIVWSKDGRVCDYKSFSKDAWAKIISGANGI